MDFARAKPNLEATIAKRQAPRPITCDSAKNATFGQDLQTSDQTSYNLKIGMRGLRVRQFGLSRHLQPQPSVSNGPHVGAGEFYKG